VTEKTRLRGRLKKIAAAGARRATRYRRGARSSAGARQVGEERYERARSRNSVTRNENDNDIARLTQFVEASFVSLRAVNATVTNAVRTRDNRCNHEYNGRFSDVREAKRLF